MRQNLTIPALFCINVCFGCGQGGSHEHSTRQTTTRAEGLRIEVEKRVARDVSKVETRQQHDDGEAADLRGSFQTATVVRLDANGVPHMDCGSNVEGLPFAAKGLGASYE